MKKEIREFLERVAKFELQTAYFPEEKMEFPKGNEVRTEFAMGRVYTKKYVDEDKFNQLKNDAKKLLKDYLEETK